jgi:hypothetical protein
MRYIKFYKSFAYGCARYDNETGRILWERNFDLQNRKKLKVVTNQKN